MNHSRIYFSILILAFCFSVVHAQGVPTSSGIQLDLSSDNPSPGQTVDITARSYSLDINNSKLTWYIDGKSVLSGIGSTKYSILAPDLGKRINVKVTAIDSIGNQVSTSVSIGSGLVDMIIEPDGYIPPFFQGKLPIIYQNMVKIVAIPHLANSAGVEYDPKTLVYKWTKDDQVIDDQSGYGKQAISLRGDIVPRSYSLKVTVATRDNSAQAVGRTSIEFQSPNINFYINDSLYGPLLNKAIDSTVRLGSQKEVGVLAVPFGFDANKGDSNLTLDWLINNISHPELSSNRSIVLRAPDGSTGSSDIHLTIRNNSQILQGANGALSAIFSAGNSASVSPVPVNF